MKKYYLSFLVCIFIVIYSVQTLANTKQYQPEQIIIEEIEQIETKIESFYIPEMPKYNIKLKEEYQKLIWDECLKYNFSYEYALAVAFVESSFNHNAISKNGDKGLFQINKIVHKEIEQELIQNFNPLNAEHNIKAGIYLLQKHANFWRNKGYSEEEIFSLTYISYNMGLEGSIKYVNKYGSKYSKSEKLLMYKSNLERLGVIE